MPHPCRCTGTQSVCENCSAPSSFSNPVDRTYLAGLEPLPTNPGLVVSSLLLAAPQSSQKFWDGHRSKHGKSRTALSYVSPQRSS